MTHTSRRALLGAALATAGTAAAAGSALAFQPDPDAEITVLADAALAGLKEADRLSLLEDALGSTAEDRQRKREFRIRQEVLTDEGWDMRARLAVLRPATKAGLQAKARVAQAFSDVEQGGSAYKDESLLWSLANDVLGVASRFDEGDDEEEEADASPLPTAGRHDADAELIALCNEYVSRDCRYLALADELAPLLPHDPAAEGLGEAMEILDARTCELEAELAQRRPVTLAGVLALARAARHQLSADQRNGAVNVPPEGELAWIVIESLTEPMVKGGAFA